MTRGIIVTTPFRVTDSTVEIEVEFDPIALRQYALYWDKIDSPDNNVHQVGARGESAEITFLRSAGILERSMHRLPPFTRNPAWTMATMQHNAFKIRSHVQPGVWSMAQLSSRLVSPNVGNCDTSYVEVELYKAIPIPTIDVALEDVLNFKELRKDELLHFRSAMDDLYQKTLASSDFPRAKMQAHEHLSQSLEALHRVYSETFPARLLSSLKVELSASASSIMALGGAAAAEPLGIPISLGAAAGAIAAAIKFDLKFGRQSVSVPPELKPYVYLHSIHRDLE